MTDTHHREENKVVNKTNWSFIVDCIQRQQCVLFIGPDIYTDENGMTLEKALYDFLESDELINSYIKKYYPDEGFFRFNKRSHKRQVISKMREFYSSNNVPSLKVIDKIAELPFHIFFTFSPGKTMYRQFKEKGFACSSDFYFKNHPPKKEFISPSVDCPLVYSLLGDVDTDESLILTHEDLFSYLRSIFKEESMAPEIREELTRSSCFIFLGLPFEKWYMQLLLNIFNFKSDEFDELERYALHSNGEKSIQEFFEDQFHFEFIAEDIPNFISELYKRCKEKGILRKSSNKVDSKTNIDEIKNLLANAQRAEAIEAAKKILEARRPSTEILLDELSLLSARHELLEKQRRLNIISFEKASLEDNLLNVSMLELVNNIKF